VSKYYQRKPENENHPCYVYVIGCWSFFVGAVKSANDAVSAVKVGVSHDVNVRLSDLQIGNPFQLEVIYKITTTRKMAYAAESAFHKCHKDVMIGGEWFDCSCDYAYKWLGEFLETLTESKRTTIGRSGSKYSRLKKVVTLAGAG